MRRKGESVSADKPKRRGPAVLGTGAMRVKHPIVVGAIHAGVQCPTRAALHESRDPGNAGSLWNN